MSDNVSSLLVELREEYNKLKNLRKSSNPFGTGKSVSPLTITESHSPKLMSNERQNILQKISSIETQIHNQIENESKVDVIDTKQDIDPLNTRMALAPNPDNERALQTICSNIDANDPQITLKCNTVISNLHKLSQKEIQKQYNDICFDVREYCDAKSLSNEACNTCKTHSSVIQVNGGQRKHMHKKTTRRKRTHRKKTRHLPTRRKR